MGTLREPRVQWAGAGHKAGQFTTRPFLPPLSLLLSHSPVAASTPDAFGGKKS